MKLRVWIKRVVWVVLAMAGVSLLAYAFTPKPVRVDLAAVERGPMQVTVNQEGKTRVRDRYVISAPLAGQLERIEWKAGDAVEKGKTILGRIRPTPPSLLDVRAREEAVARVGAAEAQLERTRPVILRAEAELAQARSQLARTQRLVADQAASGQELEDAQLAVQVREAELRVAQSAQNVAKFELEQAKAALTRMEAPATSQPATFEIASPIDGQVLRVIQESSVPVTPGMPLLEVGDVTELEAVIDVLSRDAVKVKPGARVYFDRWGGEQPLIGAVRRVEPSGFTKISALGVEEQRVNVIVDFAVPEGRTLGDFFRVDARIVVWERADALKAPVGALFRNGERWAVYVANDGRAKMRMVEVGRMSGLDAEVIDGLSAGEKVVVHPGDKVKDGVAVAARTVSETTGK